MNPHQICCPIEDCPARGQLDKGNIKIHDRKKRRYRCVVCSHAFSETKGTPFYRLHKERELFTLIVKLLARGCPRQAIVFAFGLDERTVADWEARAGLQCQKVQEHLVEQGRELGEVQCDELRVKCRRASVVWMAFAIQVGTRLWLGGAVAGAARRRSDPAVAGAGQAVCPLPSDALLHRRARDLCECNP
jgi:transposase-like protein